jgi:DNA-binding NarL/FixJ family response regulator
MKQILLVEDSALLRQSIKDMLGDFRNICIEDFATTQQDAISLLDKKQYDVMIVDIELLQGNGFEVVKHTLDKDYPLAPPTTVMLTNHANRYYKELAKNLGIKYFFDKSMDFEMAIETIEKETQQLN